MTVNPPSWYGTASPLLTPVRIQNLFFSWKWASHAHNRTKSILRGDQPFATPPAVPCLPAAASVQWSSLLYYIPERKSILLFFCRVFNFSIVSSCSKKRRGCICDVAEFYFIFCKSSRFCEWIVYSDYLPSHCHISVTANPCLTTVCLSIRYDTFRSPVSSHVME